MQDGRSDQASTIGEVVDKLQRRIDALPHDQVHRRSFIKTYQRTTQAVGEAVDAAFFEDPEWVVRWDIAFADLFIVAHDADQGHGPVPRPWRLAFQADPNLPTIVHLLLGMNAHINYDLPQDAPDYGRLNAAFITVAALAVLSPKATQAEDQELKIGVVAAESGSFVSAGNTIVAAAKLASQGQLVAYQHHGFWQPMDTYRESVMLNDLWDSGRAPWKVWS